MISYSIYNIPEIEKIGVYAIRNARTNRYYVGSTVNIYNRFLLHSRDIRKAGGINRKMQEDCETNEEFEFLILETFEDGTITIEQLRKIERAFMIKYNAIDTGYNTNLPFNNGSIPPNTVLKSRKVLPNYDEKSKERTMKYLKEKRDKLTLNLPLGDKERYKAHAQQKGKSLTGLIVDLLEQDIRETDSQSNLNRTEGS